MDDTTHTHTEQRRWFAWCEHELDARGMRRRKWALLLWAAFVVACVVFPGSPMDGVPLCPFRALTGYSCPGCGMTRACTSIFGGHGWESLSYNPFGVVLVAGWSVGVVWWGTEYKKGRALRGEVYRRFKRIERFLWIFGLLVVGVFGSVRLILELSGFLTPV